MPGYKHKERGRNVVIYPIDAISKPLLVKGVVKLSQTNIELTTQAKKVDPSGSAVPHRREPPRRGLPHQVRIVPKLDHYVIEVVYTVDEPIKSKEGFIAGVDLGLNNLMAITSNQSGIKPLLVNGRPLKSINQLFNKRVAKAQFP